MVKPLGRGHYTDTAGTEQVVWTTEIFRDSPVLERLAGAPFIVQTRLNADRHLRAVTVRDRCWVCEAVADARLRPRERHLLALRVADYAREQIVELTGLSPRTVDRQLVRARRKLRDARRAQAKVG